MSKNENTKMEQEGLKKTMTLSLMRQRSKVNPVALCVCFLYQPPTHTNPSVVCVLCVVCVQNSHYVYEFLTLSVVSGTNEDFNLNQ